MFGLIKGLLLVVITLAHLALSIILPIMITWVIIRYRQIKYKCNLTVAEVCDAEEYLHEYKERDPLHDRVDIEDDFFWNTRTYIHTKAYKIKEMTLCDCVYRYVVDGMEYYIKTVELPNYPATQDVYYFKNKPHKRFTRKSYESTIRQLIIGIAIFIVTWFCVNVVVW